MIPPVHGPSFVNYENFETRSAPVFFLPSAWMCFPWACRTILKSRSKKVRPACAWGQRFSANAIRTCEPQRHRDTEKVNSQLKRQIAGIFCSRRRYQNQLRIESAKTFSI